MIHEFGACPLCDKPCSFTMSENVWVCDCDCSEVSA